MTHTLITGGAGYIGSHAVLAARDAGLGPVVIDDLYSGFERAIPADVPFFRGSVLDEAFLGKIFDAYRIEGIMHFAAYLNVEESTRLPFKYYENNVRGTLCLLRAAQRAQTVRHFVFSSTCATYGNPATIPVDETCPQRPISPYGASKLCAELLIKNFSEIPDSPMSHALLRYFNVAGADPDRRVGPGGNWTPSLVTVCAQAALGQRPRLVIYGTDYPTPDGTAVRDYVHVSDLADAHVLAMRYLRGGKPSVAFNLGCGRGYSVREVIDTMKRVAGVEFEVLNGERRPGDTAAIYADPQRARAELGFAPRYGDLESICRTALEWQRSKPY